MRRMLRDLVREAVRSLLHDRRFTAVAVALLAVTIGAVTAVYAIVHAVVLRPFPFADQDRLVVIWQRDDRRALPVIEVAYGEMRDWESRSRSIDGLAVIGSVNWSLALAGSPQPESVPLSAVSASFFRVAGVRPAIGRGLEPHDEEGPLPRVMVISHGLWVRRFGADPAIVNRTVSATLDTDTTPVPVEIAGVMPDGFDFPRGADIWVPAAPLVRHASIAFGPDKALAGLRVFFVLGRLRSGVSLASATRELSGVMRSATSFSGTEPNSTLVLTPIATYLLGPAGPVLWALFGGAALMLAIACANVAGLQVARSARRQRALAIRVALGASNRHLIAGTLLESALLTAAALAGAVIVAFVTTRTLVWLAPAGVPRLEGVGLSDPTVMAFGALMAFATVLVCGLWPAVVARRLDAISVLAHGNSVASDPRGRLIQRGVVIAQVAIALTLLAGTALFVRTLRQLDRTALGFNPDHLIAISIAPATNDLDRWNAFYEALIARVETLPDVAAVGAVALRPLSGPIGWDTQPILHGQIEKDPRTWTLNPNLNLQVVSPGYFSTMGIRLLRGRLFTARDTASSPGVAVISETAARRLWPGREAVGQRLRESSYRIDSTAPSSDLWQTVIGVVDDVRYRGLTDVRLDFYVPAAQSTNRVQQLMVRTRGNPAQIVEPVRAAVREIEASASVSDATVMTEVVAAESAPWRFLMRVFVTFAALAAALAAVGLSAVIAVTVSARRRELAVRAALGADRSRLRSLMLREGLWLVGGGLLLGLAGALALGRTVSHLLVGVDSHDPLALTAAAGLAAAAGVLASWIPARRAADADPLEALRSE